MGEPNTGSSSGTCEAHPAVGDTEGVFLRQGERAEWAEAEAEEGVEAGEEKERKSQEVRGGEGEVIPVAEGERGGMVEQGEVSWHLMADTRRFVSMTMLTSASITASRSAAASLSLAVNRADAGRGVATSSEESRAQGMDGNGGGKKLFSENSRASPHPRPPRPRLPRSTPPRSPATLADFPRELLSCKASQTSNPRCTVQHSSPPRPRAAGRLPASPRPRT
ncbi:unnamed protein product [Closterium sp. NIES-53]